jgi:hypothetical protein
MTYIVNPKALLDVLSAVTPLADGAKFCPVPQLGTIKLVISREWITGYATDRYVGGVAHKATGYETGADGTDGGDILADYSEGKIKVGDVKPLLPFLRSIKRGCVTVDFGERAVTFGEEYGERRIVAPLYLPDETEADVHKAVATFIAKRLELDLRPSTITAVDISKVAQFSAAAKAFGSSINGLDISAAGRDPWILTSPADPTSGFVGILMPVRLPDEADLPEIRRNARQFWAGVL